MKRRPRLRPVGVEGTTGPVWDQDGGLDDWLDVFGGWGEERARHHAWVLAVWASGCGTGCGAPVAS